MALDKKQQRLVEAWLARAKMPGEDEYGKFMAGWIAFNAVCYAFFAAAANRRRPDLSDGRGLAEVTEVVQSEVTIEPRAGAQVRLRIRRPGPIQIDIRERYAEDIIYDEFAKAYGQAFRDLWSKDVDLAEGVRAFVASLKHPNGDYVVNMLKASQHSESADLSDMISKNIVVPLTAPDDLGQIVGALYQVRCNVFHGEKVPGEPNDDRIVRTARPVLLEIIGRALRDV